MPEQIRITLNNLQSKTTMNKNLKQQLWKKLI
jgi:hypothetical protein